MDGCKSPLPRGANGVLVGKKVETCLATVSAGRRKQPTRTKPGTAGSPTLKATAPVGFVVPVGLRNHGPATVSAVVEHVLSLKVVAKAHL